MQTEENSFKNSSTVFKKGGPTISKCFSSTCACAWGEIVPLILWLVFLLKFRGKTKVLQYIGRLQKKYIYILYLVTFFSFLVVCRGRIDLAFILDASGSVGLRNFRRCLAFVQNMARVFTISRSYTRFAVVVYSSRASKKFGFNRYTNRRSLLRAIGRIRYTGGGTKTGYAISYTYKNVLRYSRRKNKMVIIMTDGRSYDNVARPAQGLRRRGIRVLSFGVGKKYSMRQLLQMSASRLDVFTADFKNLGSAVRLIKRKACRGIKTFLK